MKFILILLSFFIFNMNSYGFMLSLNPADWFGGNRRGQAPPMNPHAGGSHHTHYDPMPVSSGAPKIQPIQSTTNDPQKAEVERLNQQISDLERQNAQNENLIHQLESLPSLIQLQTKRDFKIDLSSIPD